MIKACLIILSCYVGSFDAKKTAACAINPNEIIGIMYEPMDGRYMLHMRGKYIRYSTIVETPSQVMEKVNGCK